VGGVDRTPGVPGDINIPEGVDRRAGRAIEPRTSELDCCFTGA